MAFVLESVGLCMGCGALGSFATHVRHLVGLSMREMVGMRMPAQWSPFASSFTEFFTSSTLQKDIDHGEDAAAYDKSPDGISHSSLLLYNQ